MNEHSQVVITLREYVDNRFEAQEKAVNAALAAAQKAVEKAEAASEKRFECVAADTPILCADLIWRKAQELTEGDELIAFDETSPDRRGRRYRRATVISNSVQEDELLLVNTSMGAVRCNAGHPWLTRPQDETVQWKWVKSRDLRQGDAVHCPLDVWEVDRSWEAGWLAGMYDGEGCLTLDKNKRSQLSMAQHESATSTKIERALKGRVPFVGVYRNEPGTPSTPRNTCAFFHFIVSAMPHVLTLLGSVRPPRLLAKAEIAWLDKPIGGWHRSAIVESVDSAGRGFISQLSTSTKTYIAAGFAMHNSVNEFRAALNDNARLLMPRSESEQVFKTFAEKIDVLTSRVNARDDRGQGMNQSWVLLVAAIAVITAIVSAVIAVTK